MLKSRISQWACALAVVAAASLASGAVWQAQSLETDPLSALTNEQAVLLSNLMFDEEEDCPDLTDPSAPPNRHFCELGCRIDFLLGNLTCSQYVDCWLACQSIQN